MLIGTISLAVFFLMGVSYLNNNWEGPQKEEFVRQARRWGNELRKKGENPSESKLMELSFGTGLSSEEEIIIASFFTEEEFISLLEKISKKRSNDYALTRLYLEPISLHLLDYAILAKRLSVSIDNLKEGIEIVEAKETLRSLTEKEKEQLKLFKKLKKQYATIFHQIISLTNENNISPEFELRPSGFAGVPKFTNRNEMLEAVHFDEDFMKIIGEESYEEEVAKKMNQVEQKPESLALTDMKNFLLKNDLPEDVSEKIKKTIQEVEDQLEESKQKQKEERLRMEAETLIKTAKEYHHMKK